MLSPQVTPHLAALAIWGSQLASRLRISLRAHPGMHPPACAPQQNTASCPHKPPSPSSLHRDSHRAGQGQQQHCRPYNTPGPLAPVRPGRAPHARAPPPSGPGAMARPRPRGLPRPQAQPLPHAVAMPGPGRPVPPLAAVAGLINGCEIG